MKVRSAAAPVGLGPEDDGEEGDMGQSSTQDLRNRLNAMLEDDSQSFRGADLANLIREKYGKSYDAIFIQKDFMGRKLLALNIMWKYQEQRSFPLTEDEYIYRLDGIAETLREWGAVSMVKNSLKSTRERPRIGKAVSLMIDPELLGARGNEWLTS
ncbi:hypothetical protein KFL_000790370 [Klebsormidium nitens]|uniref:DUF3067 domain-containing protein n=1 Tax=Klebsormidium nitens TaxID=105231 RepID=A0A1Y1HU95_KLENI|nr:hypothetical protein KFL_000790370 [Klebsormidium nitens]|eukprot:GAQ81412.1 hypothetical protein KFL_000790370 [Klebsormidium nitens]